MSKDELIRVLASTRTDLNKIRMMMDGALNAVSDMELSMSLDPSPYLQTLETDLRSSVYALDRAVEVLNKGAE